MKTTSLLTAFGIAIGTWAVPAAADPWKDESGHGRWERYEHRDRDWKPRRHYREHRRERHRSDVYIEIRPAPAYRPAPSYESAGSAHVEWCYSRYRSYREWDNTFQPYNGPRRPCYSPYN